MQFWLPCWKNFAKNLKSYRPNCEIQIGKCFYQRSCFPWKQFCGHVECSSDRPVNRNLRGTRKKIDKNPNKKPRNQCSSDYRAWKDLPKNQKTISLKCEKHLEKCFFQRRCFPWKQSCGHKEWSSDRLAHKILRKVREKLA